MTITCKFEFEQKVRHRLNEFEGNLRVEPQDKALTADELRECDGQRIWIRGRGGTVFIINADYSDPVFKSKLFDYGKTWFAYNHEPRGVGETE